MKAIHVLSTQPTVNYYRRSASPYQAADFEILTSVMSALEWRRHNGTICLYTDDAGHEAYEQLGLLDLWDGGIDTSCLERTSKGINCDVFWSFGKIAALQNEPAPCCLLDTDLVVWRNIRRLLTNPVMSLHEEPLTFSVYVNRSCLTSPEHFCWDGLDWSVSPCSAALLVFLENELKEVYSDRAMSFMYHNPIEKEANGEPVHPIFVEQRLLPMCAKARNIGIGAFLQDYRGLRLRDGSKNKVFTHLWNAKSVLLSNSAESRSMCEKYARRINRDYPEVSSILARSERFKDLFR